MEPDSQRVPFEEAEWIAPTFGGMEPGNAVLKAALRLLRGESIGSIQPLQMSLREPHPKRWKERAAAAWALGRARLHEDEADSAAGTLIEVLEHGFREPWRSKLARWLLRTYAPSLGIAVIFATSLLIDGPYYADPPWLPIVLTMTLFIGTVSLAITIPMQSYLERRQNDRVRVAAAAALAHRRHVEAVGPLAGCLFDSNSEVCAAASLALHELLPGIAESDYGVLGADSMAKLGRALFYPDGSLVTRILDALEKVGTSHVTRHVERLIAATRSTLTKDRAQRVIDALNERSRREAVGKELLRPSGRPADSSELLRPSRNQAEAEIEQLLRPSGDNLN